MPRPPGKHYQNNTQKAIRALESQGYEVKPALQSAIYNLPTPNLSVKK